MLPRFGLDVIGQDLRIGLRMLRRAPGHSAVALTTLALCIGANTLMFSIVDAALLRPLPYARPDEVLSIVGDNADHSLRGLNVSFPKLQWMQQRSRSLTSAGAYAAFSASLVVKGAAESVPAARVTGNFIQLLGIALSSGRGFTDAEEHEGGADVALVTDGLWRSRFGGDANVVGRQVRIDGRSITIVGVLPAAFRFPLQQPMPDIWMPRVFENSIMAADRVRSGASFLVVFARRASGQSLAQVQADLDAINEDYRREFPGMADAGLSLHATTLEEQLVGAVRSSLLVLLGAVGVVLVIGCSNIASMLMARATTRSTELAVRRALGASQGRLRRQLLTESGLLALGGGVLGCALASAGLRLASLLPAGLVPQLSDARVDVRVLVFALLASILCGLGAGLLPAMRASRASLSDAMRQGGRGASEGRQGRRARGGLVVAQVALAVVLVTGAGLLLRSFVALMRVEPGFQPTAVMTFSLSLPASRYGTPPEQAEFYRRLVEDTRVLPTVESAAISSFLPFGGTRFVYVCAQGAVCLGVGKDPVMSLHQITPDYLTAMRIPLLDGRAFTEHDTAQTMPVAIINRSAANRHFPDGHAVGKYLVQSRGNIRMEIVGVIGDVRSRGLDNPVLDELFVPQSQFPAASMSLVVRSAGDPAPLVAAVRRAMAARDPSLSFSNVSRMSDLLSDAVAQPRLTAELTGGFGALALLLATLGLYGVLAYTVSQRRQEIGIRLALGAQRRDVIWSVLRQGLTLVLAGVALGAALALASSRVLAAILVGTSPRDPWTFGSVAVVLVAVGLGASYLPARRAAGVDPVLALRR